MRRDWCYVMAPLCFVAMAGQSLAADSDPDAAVLITPPVISERAAALAALYSDDSDDGALVADDAAGAVTTAQPEEEETVEIASIRTWADELQDGEMQGLRGAGYNFNFTASFILADSGVPTFDFGASVLPDSVTGAPTMTQTGTGSVQVSAQIASLPGFSGIGTFVTVEGSSNITTTTTNVNIVYAPNLSNQAANATIQSFMGLR